MSKLRPWEIPISYNEEESTPKPPAAVPPSVGPKREAGDIRDSFEQRARRREEAFGDLGDTPSRWRRSARIPQGPEAPMVYRNGDSNSEFGVDED